MPYKKAKIDSPLEDDPMSFLFLLSGITAGILKPIKNGHIVTQLIILLKEKNNVILKPARVVYFFF